MAGGGNVPKKTKSGVSVRTDKNGRGHDKKGRFTAK